MARSLALVLLVLMPALAGCLEFLDPPKPPVVPEINPCIVQEAFVVPALQLRMDSPYGNVRLAGRGLAVPVKCGASEEGAVYLNTTAGYRADAIFQVRERDGLQGATFVQGPLGQWSGVRGGQNWTAAQPADIAAFGFADAQALFKRASKILPINHTAPEASSWSVNGTLFAHVQPHNFSVATEEGPYVFQRNATNFVIVENLTVMTWSVLNRTFYAAGADAIASAEVRDPEIADLQAAWASNKVQVRVITPPFRRTDLFIDEEPAANITNAEYPGVALVTMIKSTSKTIRDSLVELKSANLTFTMAPV